MSLAWVRSCVTDIFGKKGKPSIGTSESTLERTRTVYGMRVNRKIPKVAKESLLWHTFYPNILESMTLSKGMDYYSLRFTTFQEIKKSDQDRWVSVGRTWEEHQVKEENIPRGCVLKDRLQIFEREKEIEQSKVVYIVGWRWRASSAQPHSRLKRLDLHDERDGAQDWITKGFSHQEIVRRITGKKESETRNNGKSNITPTTAMPTQQK